MICEKCGCVMGYTIGGHICSCGNASVEGINLSVSLPNGKTDVIVLGKNK